MLFSGILFAQDFDFDCFEFHNLEEVVEDIKKNRDDYSYATPVPTPEGTYIVDVTSADNKEIGEGCEGADDVIAIGDTILIYLGGGLVKTFYYIRDETGHTQGVDKPYSYTINIYVDDPCDALIVPKPLNYGWCADDLGDGTVGLKYDISLIEAELQIGRDLSIPSAGTNIDVLRTVKKGNAAGEYDIIIDKVVYDDEDNPYPAGDEFEIQFIHLIGSGHTSVSLTTMEDYTILGACTE